MSDVIHVPFVIYNGQVAYQLNSPNLGYPIDEKYEFEDRVTPYGFMLLRTVKDQIKLGRFKAGMTSTDMADLTTIHPKGLMLSMNLSAVKDDERDKFTPVPILPNRRMCHCDLHSHNEWIVGSLDYTQNLDDTIRAFRMHFAISPSPITVEPIPLFLKKIKDAMDKKFPNEDPLKLNDLPQVYPLV